MTTAVRTSRQSDRTSVYMEVKTMEEAREELNRAIWLVIISEGKCKKDMKETIRLIKSAGYEIVKYDTGKWSVENRKTNRHIRATLRWREIYLNNSYRHDYRINCEGCSYKDAYDRRKIDFVGILEKPLNDEWRYLQWHRQYAGTRHDTIYSTKFKYEQLKDARHWVKWEERYIVDDKKKIAEAQKDLARHIEDKVKAELKLEELRKKLGLKDRR